MDAEPRSKRIQTEQRCPLPEEIVEDILALLPVKSLARFRCVSPEWNDLINSPELAKLHSERSRGKHNRLFLKPRGHRLFYAWNRKTGAAPALETILDDWRQPQGDVFPLGKSCHGLVLLRFLDYDVHCVWNPSACEIVPLPDGTPARDVWRGGRTNAIYGMGYCSATERYKVVRMHGRLQNTDGFHSHDTVCEVFTLDESTHWRPAATQPPPACKLRVNRRQGAVLCNGNLHFVQEYIGPYHPARLTVFNVSDENFSTMILPEELHPHACGFMLTELDGCLCAYRTGGEPRKMDDPYYDIWLLKDYQGGKWERLRCINWESMSKTESAPLESSWIAPLDMYYDATDQKKKKIMFGTGRCKVFVVDPHKGVPEILFSPDDTIIKECHDSDFPTMGLFEESLVSVGRTSEEIIFSSPSAQAWSEVLTYLPARTVGRLNQVCKGWRAMIKAECFVSAHLDRANLNRSPCIMFTNGMPYGFAALEKFINTSNVPPLVDSDSRLVCSKSCHGLNAGSFTKYDFVCNPLTKYYKAMPLDNGRDLTATSLYEEMQRTPPDNVDGVFAGRLSLGYDPNLRIHLLVRLAYKERNQVTRDYKLECKIRLVEHHDWVEIEPPPRPVADVSPAHASGKLYWLVDQELAPRSSGCEIVMFDLSTLEFQVLEGPPCGYCSGMSIVELEGEVCVACPTEIKTNTMEIWAMNGTTTWCMRYFIDLARFSSEYLSEKVTMLAIDPNDGRILLSTGRALGYYDTNTADLETIYRLDANIQDKKFVPVLFMESLVTPCDARL